MRPLLFLCLALLAWPATAADRWPIPIEVKKLDNGLTVVVSPDPSAPVVGISVVYKVGIRLEPRGRTGFAHLFEHLMFQGTPKAKKGVFDKVTSAGGGWNNGSTLPDFTNYYVSAPVSALDALLWLEADRMRTLDFSAEGLQNQRDVVKEEIRSKVTNTPYGGFAWIDLPKLAFDKWENSHDGFGSFEDLDRAALADVRAFHRDFYGPNNAVLAIAGDVTPARAFALAKKYFGGIARRPVPPRSDVSEPLNDTPRRLQQGDPLAQVPALAVGWKMPQRGSADHAPMVVLADLLTSGSASVLVQGLVKGREIALGAEGFYSAAGPWDFDGPTLFTVMAMYKPTTNADALLAAMDEEIAKIAQRGPDSAMLERVKTRMQADWNNGLEGFVDRADLLARLQALWGDAKVAMQVPAWIDAVTAADVQRVAALYLAPQRRSVIDRQPQPATPAAAASGATK